MVNIRLLLTAVLAAVLIGLLVRVMLTRIETTGVDWVMAILALAVAAILFIAGMIYYRELPSCARR
jgi:uncharacterized protein YacL